MSGRGRTGKASTGTNKREQRRPPETSSRSESRGNASPAGARQQTEKEKQRPPAGGKAKEQSSGTLRCASGNAHIASTKKKPTSATVDPLELDSTSPMTNGDVKAKQKREPAKIKGNPACKDVAITKKTSSQASGTVGSKLHASLPQKTRGASNPEPKCDKKNTICPSRYEPINRVEKKAVSSANKVLLSTLDKLKIKMDAKSDSSSIVNDIVETIIKHMKEKSVHFSAVQKLCTGSYYENVKISKPDEFDVMLALRLDRVDLQKFDSEGAFYSVALKRTPKDYPLRCFLDEDNTISARRMLNEFRENVKKAVEPIPGVVVERKKAGCPAVTLLIQQNGGEIGLDIVLSLEVHSSWPTFTEGGLKIDSWLGTKVKRNFKTSPFYLVPKYAGKGNEERDGISGKDVWRLSFSHVEKDILKNHGQAKTCCESAGRKCCRKPCLKLLKYLLHQLKEKHPRKLSKFFSYLCKTTLLHACTEREHDSDWDMDNLNYCFQLLLEDFVGYLKWGVLSNFFIPTHNLLGSTIADNRKFLADCIENERINGYPIFKE